jgi:site-specific recombinase
VAGGASERVEVACVPNRNTEVGFLKDRQAIFNANKRIYEEQSMRVTMSDMQRQKIAIFWEKVYCGKVLHIFFVGAQVITRFT